MGREGLVTAMAAHLIALSLGPAHESLQEFIATSRRCHDLWLGSWLISELSKAAARGLAEVLGPEGHANLLFPAPDASEDLQPGTTLAVANKLLALLPQGIEPRAAAESAVRASNKRLQEIAEAAFKEVGKDDPLRNAHFHTERARQQIEEMLDVVWVAVPMETESGFNGARSQADAALAARKATRTWSQPSWAQDGVPKSSLDGQRESVLDESIYDRSLATGALSSGLDPQHRRRWYEVHGSERLCGVGLLKRFGGRVLAPEPLPSTSHLAALPALRGLDQAMVTRPEVKAAWVRYRKELEEAKVLDEFEGRVPPRHRSSLLGNVDGEALYAGRVRAALEDAGRGEAARQVEVARRAVLSAARRGEPLAYYAILVVDGDSMGDLIRRLRTPGEQRALSAALTRFAGAARGIVEEGEGALIYAGGDDVLALLPLHRALGAAQALAGAFPKALVEALPATEDEPSAAPSLSAGLAVIHAWTPLEGGLLAAHAAERFAKREPGKGALAITVLKRSGEPITVRGRWGELVPRLDALTRLYEEGEAPATMIHELTALEGLTAGIEGAALERAREVQRLEAKRILGRKQMSDATRMEVEGWLRCGGRMDAAQLGRQLAVAQLLARAAQQARGGEQ